MDSNEYKLYQQSKSRRYSEQQSEEERSFIEELKGKENEIYDV
jgi:hypothetical protein